MTPQPVPEDVLQTEVDLLLVEAGGHPLAVGAIAVAEILEEGTATPVPEAPDFLEGILSVRDVMAPLIDIRTRLQVGAPSDASQLLLVRGATGRLIAMRVDRVLEILRLRLREIEPPPDEASLGSSARYVLGMVRRDHRTALLLDFPEILTSDEQLTLEELLEGLESKPEKTPEKPTVRPKSKPAGRRRKRKSKS